MPEIRGSSVITFSVYMYDYMFVWLYHFYYPHIGSWKGEGKREEKNRAVPWSCAPELEDIIFLYKDSVY